MRFSGRRQRKEDSIEHRKFKQKQHRKQTWSEKQPITLAAIGIGWTSLQGLVRPGLSQTGHEFSQLKSGLKRRGSPASLPSFPRNRRCEVEAMAAQIIPTDSSPGAREARVVHFIDQALASFVRDHAVRLRERTTGSADENQAALPGRRPLLCLTSEQQIKVLTEIERTPFFTLVRTHTIIGFFSRPEHGGNHNKVGWELIGYDDSLKHKPPFGYYDGISTRHQG